MGSAGGAAGVGAWTVVEAGSHRVGLVGVLDPDAPEDTPAAEDLDVTDPAAAVEGRIRRSEFDRDGRK